MDTPMNETGSGIGSTSTAEKGALAGNKPASELCPTCGQAKNSGLEQFLGRLGISEEMVNNLKSSMQNVDMEQYLTTAREYLSNGGTKATNYAKENPGKVAAGVAALAVGTGLLISALNRE